ncbi:hypothetical protein QYE76_014994 [Lolium multiflorum]|uniref:Uncharacterized protein n=1 Tax=Lolium multiflorum TaxID=4521 RepID=A0AAD8X8Q0_LOLMU|nr:hypothetical protein QYE76_014994 [Lolium multiflorum]
MRGLRLWGVLSGEVSCPPRPVAPTAHVEPSPIALASGATQADKDAATSADDTALADYDRKCSPRMPLSSWVFPPLPAGLFFAIARLGMLTVRGPSEYALQQGDSTIDEFYIRGVFEFLSRLRKEFEPCRAQLLARGRVPLSEVPAELRARKLVFVVGLEVPLYLPLVALPWRRSWTSYAPDFVASPAPPILYSFTQGRVSLSNLVESISPSICVVFLLSRIPLLSSRVPAPMLKMVSPSEKYIQDLLARAALGDERTVDTPMELNVMLRPTDGDPLPDPTRYRHLVGSLVWKRRRKILPPATLHLLLEIVARSDLVTLIRCAAVCKPLRSDILSVSFVRRVMEASCQASWGQASSSTSTPVPCATATASWGHWSH